MLANTGDGGGRNTRSRYILYPEHLGFWSMRKTNTLLCLQKLKLSRFLSIALKQDKDRPRSSGTPVLVTLYFFSRPIAV